MLIKDLEFNPTCTDTEYNNCVDFFSTIDKERPSCTSYIVVGGDTLKNTYKYNGCHASIGSNQGFQPSLAGTEIAFNRKNLKNCEGAWQYLDWFVNNSHASRFIVNKPEHRTLEWLADNGVIVSADVMQPLFQMIMIWSRAFSERAAIAFDKWKELVDQGFDPHFAHNAIMCTTGGDSQGRGLSDDKLVYGKPGHVTTYMLGIKEMQNFCDGELGSHLHEMRHYRKYQSVYGCNKLFHESTRGPESNRSFLTELFDNNEEYRDALRKFRNEDSTTKEYRPPNPFTQPTTMIQKKPHQVTWEEYFKVVFPFMKEKGMFINVKES